MKDYTTDTPEFSEVIQVIETSDPVHAEIPNITFRQLFQNTLCNRKSIKNPEFDDSGEVEGITGKESLLSKLVSGIPLVKWMQNVKAGFSLALYAGELVNNCVTDRADLPLSAAQGKVLMDLYTQLNSDMPRSQILTFSEGEGDQHKFAFYSRNPNKTTRLPVLIMMGSQNQFQTSMICVTLFIQDDGQNGVMIPASYPDGIESITASEHICTIVSSHLMKWASISILYNSNEMELVLF